MESSSVIHDTVSVSVRPTTVVGLSREPVCGFRFSIPEVKVHLLCCGEQGSLCDIAGMAPVEPNFPPLGLEQFNTDAQDIQMPRAWAESLVKLLETKARLANETKILKQDLISASRQVPGPFSRFLQPKVQDSA